MTCAQQPPKAGKDEATGAGDWDPEAWLPQQPESNSTRKRISGLGLRLFPLGVWALGSFRLRLVLHYTGLHDV